MKLTTSILLAPVVMVGATPPPHLTPVNVAVNDPVCVMTIVRFAAAETDGMVNTQFPFKDTVCTFPLASDSVFAVPELPSEDS
jgi:hypothetical protein